MYNLYIGKLSLRESIVFHEVHLRTLMCITAVDPEVTRWEIGRIFKNLITFF